MRDDLIDTLVGHRRFVQGGAVYAGGVNAFHLDIGICHLAKAVAVTDLIQNGFTLDLNQLRIL